MGFVMLFVGLLPLFLLLVYLLPTIKAYVRGAPDLGRVALVNILLGWTVYGWLVAPT